MLPFDEPFAKFRAHGTIVRDGAKMSKSRGNVVNPDEYIEEWGADAFRTYLMFLGPYEEGGDFQDRRNLWRETIPRPTLVFRHRGTTAPASRTSPCCANCTRQFAR